MSSDCRYSSRRSLHVTCLEFTFFGRRFFSLDRRRKGGCSCPSLHGFFVGHANVADDDQPPVL